MNNQMKDVENQYNKAMESLQDPETARQFLSWWAVSELPFSSALPVFAQHPEPSEFHTFNDWTDRGMAVQKGQHGFRTFHATKPHRYDYVFADDQVINSKWKPALTRPLDKEKLAALSSHDVETALVDAVFGEIKPSYDDTHDLAEAALQDVLPESEEIPDEAILLTAALFCDYLNIDEPFPELASLTLAELTENADNLRTVADASWQAFRYLADPLPDVVAALPSPSLTQEQEQTRDLSFAEQVDLVLSSNADRYSGDLKVCDTPNVLLQIGCKQLPMLYSRTHLFQALKPENEKAHTHGLKADTIKSMPRLIAQPAMVFDSLSRNDSIVLITTAYDALLRPLIISVRPDGQGKYSAEIISSNYITSMYGKDNFIGFAERTLAADNVLFIDKQKSQSLFSVLGVQFPEGFNNLAEGIIHQSRNIVKQDIVQNNVQTAAQVDEVPGIIDFSAPKEDTNAKWHIMPPYPALHHVIYDSSINSYTNTVRYFNDFDKFVADERNLWSMLCDTLAWDEIWDAGYLLGINKEPEFTKKHPFSSSAEYAEQKLLHVWGAGRIWHFNNTVFDNTVFLDHDETGLNICGWDDYAEEPMTATYHFSWEQVGNALFDMVRYRLLDDTLNHCFDIADDGKDVVLAIAEEQKLELEPGSIYPVENARAHHFTNYRLHFDAHADTETHLNRKCYELRADEDERTDVVPTPLMDQQGMYTYLIEHHIYDARTNGMALYYGEQYRYPVPSTVQEALTQQEYLAFQESFDQWYALLYDYDRQDDHNILHDGLVRIAMWETPRFIEENPDWYRAYVEFHQDLISSDRERAAFAFALVDQRLMPDFSPDYLPEDDHIEGLRARLESASGKPAPDLELQTPEEAAEIILHNGTNTISYFDDLKREYYHPLPSAPYSHSIELDVWNYVENLMAEAGIKGQIADVMLSGSRAWGIEHEGSNIDVVVQINNADLTESELFSIFHEEDYRIDDIPVDINPIRPEETGTMEEYLPGVIEYLDAKRDAITIAAPRLPELAQQITSLKQEMADHLANQDMSFDELNHYMSGALDSLSLMEQDRQRYEDMVKQLPPDSSDVDHLRAIEPKRKSVQNLVDTEVATVPKFEQQQNDKMGVKSAFEMRQSDNSWRDDDSVTVPVIQITEHDVTNIRADMKAGLIPRGIYTNKDTGNEIVIGANGINATLAHALQEVNRSKEIKPRLACLYQLPEIVASAIQFDTQISEAKRRYPNSLFMHQLYIVIQFEEHPYLAKLLINESYSSQPNGTLRDTHENVYDLDTISITPIGDSGFQSRGTTSEDAGEPISVSITMPQLYELVKTYDKNFFENEAAPGRADRITEIEINQVVDRIKAQVIEAQSQAQQKQLVDLSQQISALKHEMTERLSSDVQDMATDEISIFMQQYVSRLDELEKQKVELEAELKESAPAQSDVDHLRAIEPKRKSVQNLVDTEVATVPKFEQQQNDKMGVKSAFEMRQSDNSWRDDDSVTVPVITIEKRDLPDSPAGIRKDPAILRDTFTNKDTGISIIFGMRSIDETVAKATQSAKRDIDTDSRIASLYQMREIVENAICFDTEIAEPGGNKSPNTLFIHNYYLPALYNYKTYLIKLQVEESYFVNQAGFQTLDRLYNVLAVKTTPIDASEVISLSLPTSANGQDTSTGVIITPVDANRIFSPAVPDHSVGEDTSTDVTITMPQLYELVKTYDKNFFENEAAPGRADRIEEIELNQVVEDLKARISETSLLQEEQPPVDEILVKPVEVSQERLNSTPDFPFEAGDIVRYGNEEDRLQIDRIESDYVVVNNLDSVERSHGILAASHSQINKDEFIANYQFVGKGKNTVYAIYQMKAGDDYHRYRWESLERLHRDGFYPTIDDYDKVYEGEISDNVIAQSGYEYAAGALYNQLNGALPEGFTGHSLSISDVIAFVRPEPDNNSPFHWFFIDERNRFTEIHGFEKDHPRFIGKDEHILDWQAALDYFSLDEINQLSAMTGYGFTDDDLSKLAELHKAGDTETREKIEDLLDDCNFHAERGDFAEGKYDRYIIAPAASAEPARTDAAHTLVGVNQEFLPESIARMIPPFGAGAQAADIWDRTAYVKFFTPNNSWTWWVLEYDPADQIAFGLVNGLEQEFGDFSLEEMSDMNAQWMASPGVFKPWVERDQYFEPTKLRDCPGVSAPPERDRSLERDFLFGSDSMDNVQKSSIYSVDNGNTASHNSMQENIEEKEDNDVRRTNQLRSELQPADGSGHSSDGQSALSSGSVSEILASNVLSSSPRASRSSGGSGTKGSGHVDRAAELPGEPGSRVSDNDGLHDEVPDREPLLSGSDAPGEGDVYLRSTARGLGGLVPATPQERAATNISALRVLSALKEDNRHATPEEQEQLVHFTGWGGLTQVFVDSPEQKWAADTQAALHELLNDSEYAAAQESLLTAYYTPDTVISAIWDSLQFFGFSGGSVLDPSAGIGKFISGMPQSLRDQSTFMQVEPDPVSQGIAAELVPEANTKLLPFQDFVSEDDSFDIVVSNIPFGTIRIPDGKYGAAHQYIHDYFFSKAVSLVHSGGIVAFITSHGFLDKADESTRKFISTKADLLGAVRLPVETFSGTGAATTTDEDLSDITMMPDIPCRAIIKKAEMARLPITLYAAGSDVSILYRDLTENLIERKVL